PALGGDLIVPVRLPVAVGEEHLPEAGGPAPEEPEAILPRLHPQPRLDRPVHQELIAEEAIVVEHVEDERAVRREHLVLEDEGDVKVPAGEPEASGLVAGVQIVEDEVEAGEAAIDVGT